MYTNKQLFNCKSYLTKKVSSKETNYLEYIYGVRGTYVIINLDIIVFYLKRTFTCLKEVYVLVNSCGVFMKSAFFFLIKTYLCLDVVCKLKFFFTDEKVSIKLSLLDNRYCLSTSNISFDSTFYVSFLSTENFKLSNYFNKKNILLIPFFSNFLLSEGKLVNANYFNWLNIDRVETLKLLLSTLFVVLDTESILKKRFLE